MRPRCLASSFVALIITAVHGVAQEPTHMEAATHPGRGQFYSRLLLSQAEYEGAHTNKIEQVAVVKLTYGLWPTFAVLGEVAFGHASVNNREETGLFSSTIQGKYRLFKKDLGPLNTWMASGLASLTIPGNTEQSEEMDSNSRYAVASTAILERHGLNAEMNWQDSNHEPDAYSINASYLFRLVPAEYTVRTMGAWYSVVESLNRFPDDGEAHSDMAVGLLYEARRWAWELSLRGPVEQQRREDNNYRITVGLRYLP